MKTTQLFYVIMVSLFALSCASKKTSVDTSSIVTNPINLNYRFQFDDPGWREAADPVCEYFNGKYYLFASKSGGYWSSPDLKSWDYIPCKTIATLNDYAPTILVHNDSLYFLASGGSPRIFRSANPDVDRWEEVDTQFSYGNTDPAFFKDEDGRVYLYWGCSDKHPIVGVEVDPEKGFKALSTPDTLIRHNYEIYGWEAPGENNEMDKKGWNEGPCMIKYSGKYYLQYAAPGTQFRVYADGVYVGDNPLGPFTYMPASPFSFKPGGFIGGAGHGHTFKDKYGNYWHVATMKISQRHSFERRLALFPLYFTENKLIGQHSVWADYPFSIPDGKVDFEQDNRSLEWNLLSFNKPVTVSSHLSEYLPSYAANEHVENWWSAQTGVPGEWLQIDLLKKMEVNAIQVNFADQDFDIRAPHELFSYQYYIESSNDGKDWTRIFDRTRNSKDAVHELLVLDKLIEARYLRITNSKELPGKFSLYGFRVFGDAKSSLPHEVTDVKVIRNSADKRRYALTWNKQENVTGYIINVGINKDQLLNSIMVYENQYEGGFFNRDSTYCFTVDAFNESGVTKGKTIYKSE